MRAASVSTGGRDPSRAQSSVIGVALLLGMTVLALGILTASMGALVDDQAAQADAERVAADLEAAIQPVQTTGHRVGTVRFAEGQLEVVDRDMRLFEGSRIIATSAVDALLYKRADQRVAAVAGAVVRGRPGNAWLIDRPPIVGTARDDVLVVGAAKLNASDDSIGGSGVTARLSTNVSHRRRAFGPGEYAVAVETRVPSAFERFFRARGARTTRRDIDGDGIPSAIGTFPGRRRAYLVVHDMRLEVDHG